MTDSESDDVAVVVYREDDAWEVDLLPPALTEDLTGLIGVLVIAAAILPSSRLGKANSAAVAAAARSASVD